MTPAVVAVVVTGPFVLYSLLELVAILYHDRLINKRVFDPWSALLVRWERERHFAPGGDAERADHYARLSREYAVAYRKFAGPDFPWSTWPTIVRLRRWPGIEETP